MDAPLTVAQAFVILREDDCDAGDLYIFVSEVWEEHAEGGFVEEAVVMSWLGYEVHPDDGATLYVYPSN